MNWNRLPGCTLFFRINLHRSVVTRGAEVMPFLINGGFYNVQKASDRLDFIQWWLRLKQKTHLFRMSLHCKCILHARELWESHLSVLVNIIHGFVDISFMYPRLKWMLDQNTRSQTIENRRTYAPIFFSFLFFKKDFTKSFWQSWN